MTGSLKLSLSAHKIAASLSTIAFPEAGRLRNKDARVIITSHQSTDPPLPPPSRPLSLSLSLSCSRLTQKPTALDACQSIELCIQSQPLTVSKSGSRGAAAPRPHIDPPLLLLV
ncbi:hypothetical protein J6590_091678 [Homalodisca vitripennis]|nr:hypothetical protein J6590_091678 [Homalodisca vitripennis]